MSASRVKVTISKEKLVKALEDRKSELLKPSPKPAKKSYSTLIKNLEALTKKVKAGEEVGSSVITACERDLRGYYHNTTSYKNKDDYQINRTVNALNQQLKLINLSSNTEFQVGINDELYDLL